MAFWMMTAIMKKRMFGAIQEPKKELTSKKEKTELSLEEDLMNIWNLYLMNQ